MLFPTTVILIICTLEFIHLISSEANEICEQENKKTIAPEHIISALTVREALSSCEFEKNDVKET